MVGKESGGILVDYQSAYPIYGFPRANPHHDRLGRFSSGSSGFVAGKWQASSGKEAMISDIEQSLLREIPVDHQRKLAANNPKWARKQAELLTMGLDADTTVTYKNGPHSIQFTGSAKESDRKRFLSEFDALETAHPAGKAVAMSVDPSFEFDKGVGGETTPGTGHVRINEAVLADKHWPGMPVSTEVTASQYVLAHEWGHVTSSDNAKDRTVHRAAIDAGGLTRYGIAGATGVLAPEEGYAEAFAEWTLTAGQTTNPAAIVYADKNGWH